MRIIVEEMNKEGIDKLETVLRGPGNEHIVLTQTEKGGHLLPRLVLDIPDDKAVLAGDLIVIIVAHCTKLRFE
jgi:hypothetical protein